MPSLDTVIVGGRLVTPKGEVHNDLGILNGKIVAIEPDLVEQGAEEVSAENCIVIPGIVDSHVHLNEPGNTHWEGFETGTKAAVAGGVTCLFDMPLNSLPTTTNVEAFEQKRKLGEAKSVTDFALWGGLIPGNLDDLEPLFNAGVIGFKAFMSNSGLEDFPNVDQVSLAEGMKKIASLSGMRLALHAEDESLTNKLTLEKINSGKTTVSDYLASRPIEAELLAIKRAVDISGATGCPIHIVHVSCAEGIELISAAKKAGVDITCETCPHYLSLTDEVIQTAGSLAKCAPPLRNQETVAGLWGQILAGSIDTLGSDHSPCLREMKIDGNFFKAWGGISSLQHAGAISYSLLHQQLEIPLAEIAALTSLNPANRFKLADKGSISIGKDADICIADFQNTFPITEAELFYKNPHSPYVGTTPTFRARRTLVRGKTVFNNGQFLDGFRGRLVSPES